MKQSYECQCITRKNTEKSRSKIRRHGFHQVRTALRDSGYIRHCFSCDHYQPIRASSVTSHAIRQQWSITILWMRWYQTLVKQLAINYQQHDRGRKQWYARSESVWLSDDAPDRLDTEGQSVVRRALIHARILNQDIKTHIIWRVPQGKLH